ncbi:MAG TPA: hemerythrin domain-containing protein [Vineibacter sp.]|nr:hemerythrin domain-containing protein [Vineibacter sp.]
MPSTSIGQSAFDILSADHEEVAAMVESFERTTQPQRKHIATAICQALTVHTSIEEGVFYPAARQGADDELVALLDRAQAEHQSIRNLIVQIESLLESSATDEMLKMMVSKLAKRVEAHVLEEEDEIFPLVKDADVDEEALGDQLAQRKVELSRASSPVTTPIAGQPPKAAVT